VTVQFRNKDIAFRNDQFEIASYVLQILASEGEDVRPILDEVQCGTLTEFMRDGPDMDARRLRRLSLGAMSEVSRIALQRDGRANSRLGDWELLVYCLVSCGSLRNAIERMSEFFRAIDGRLHGGAILRMGTLNDEFHGRYNRRVASKNSESLL